MPKSLIKKYTYNIEIIINQIGKRERKTFYFQIPRK